MTDVDVRGARIHVRESGDPSSEPVLLLHGIGRSLEDWAPQHARLADAYRVISVDMPGFGFSQRLPEPTTLRTLAEGVLGTLDALGEHRPVHVMGNSLGGAVAMQLSVLAPDRVRTSTLVNSAGFGKEVTIALRLLAIPGLGRGMLGAADRNAMRRTERALFFDGSFVTEERIDHAVEVGRQPGSAVVFLEAARALGTLRGVSAGWRSALLAEVARHPKPTLVVWGERDLILPAHHLRAARAALPWAQSHVFAETGHMPQVEKADEFAQLVRVFLAAQQVSAR
ncbi:alpha/beta fold hydrolase [Pseudonocardia sp. 73-21]|jgi:pimeloyl-ACP methyl ester carboxylesterase|uniref:alpha/beta fold hydrolase n=1 Tax=Pseudonocardia sp. 73-21 TaxID=1895809 RepID=UPI000967D0A0|nr:alpha/beta fold hydrolase [Pseudonocardia sp. 73-21]OJY50014.1 MAG: alpha/beta hydrolase [Pseudonocardia sp. 73-21]